MTDVVVISKTIVRPESCKDGQDRVKIHLTPWDLFFLESDYTQRGLLFPQPDLETNIIISQLKSSLSLALKIFYPFAGRLVKTVHEDDQTESFFIDCDGSGVKFIHASAQTVSVSDVLEPDDGIFPGFLSGFFPVNGVISCEGVSESLLAIQVTELKDGVFVGYGCNHMVTDGSSFWNFFKTWSEICYTGSDRKTYPPLNLRGWFLGGIDYPIRVPVLETVPSLSSRFVSSHLQDKLFRFTSKETSELKAKGNSEVVDSGGGQRISSLQAVVAHMWRSIIRNRDHNPEDMTHCKVLMDIRGRLDPPLEKECFGNMVGFVTATATVREVLNNGLGWTALQINKSVGSQTSEKLRVYAENWVKEPRILNRLAKPVVSNSIGVSSSPRFGVYGIDFGWGKPIAARGGPGNTNDGKLVVYPGVEDGTIEIQTTLTSRVMEKLSTDAEFLRHVYVG